MLALAPRYRAVLPPPLPLERLVAGRSRAEVAALLPRVFNLCGGAQELAARMAMRLPVPDGLVAQAAQQVRRDHLFTLLLRLPPLLGLPTAPLPEPQDVQAALFGPGGLAAAESDPSGFLAGGAGIAPLLAHLRRAVPQGALCAPRTPYPDAATVLSPQASENSPAGRRHDHVLLQAIEADDRRPD